MADGAAAVVAGRDYPRTFNEFESFFADEAACREYLRKLRLSSLC